MDAELFFDDFFGAPAPASGLTAEEALQLAAAAALADRLPENRTSKLDRDLAHAAAAELYRADTSMLVRGDQLPGNFDLLQIDGGGFVSARIDTTDTAAAVWAYFVAPTGDAAADRFAAAAGAPTSASQPINITVVDQDTTPIPFVRLQLAGSGIARHTDPFGQASLFAEAGEYQLQVQVPFGFAPVDPLGITVTNAPLEIEITAVRELPSPVAAAGMCAVTLQVIDQTGMPLTGVEISHRIVPGYAVLEDQWMVNAAGAIVTNTQGTAQFVAARGQVYDFTVQVSPSNRVTLRRLIPDTEAATLSMLVEA